MSNIPVTVKRGVGTTMIPYLSISFDKDKGNKPIEAAPVRWIYIDNLRNDSIVNVQFTGTPDNGGASIIDSTIINEYSDGYLEVNSNNPYKSFSITLDDASDGKAILNEIKIISADEQNLLQRYAVSITLQENISTHPANYERYKLDTEVALYSHLHCQWAGNTNIDTIGRIYIWDNNNTGISASIETDESTESFGTVIYKEFSPIELTTAGLIQSGGNLNIDIKGFVTGKVCIELLDLNNNIIYAGYNIPVNTKKVEATPSWKSGHDGKEMRLTYEVNRYSDINYMEIYTLNGEVSISSLVLYDGNTPIIERSDLSTPDFTGIYGLNEYLFTKIQFTITGPDNVGVSFECRNDISGEIVNVDANTKYFIEGEGIFYLEDIKLEPSSGTAGDTEVTVTVPESTSFIDTTQIVSFRTVHNKSANLRIKRDARPLYLYDSNLEYWEGNRSFRRTPLLDNDTEVLPITQSNAFIIGKSGVVWKNPNDNHVYYVVALSTSTYIILYHVSEFVGDTLVESKIIRTLSNSGITFPNYTYFEDASVWLAGDNLCIVGIDANGFCYIPMPALITLFHSTSTSTNVPYYKSSTSVLFTKAVQTSSPDKIILKEDNSYAYTVFDRTSTDKFSRKSLDIVTTRIIDIAYTGTKNIATAFMTSSNTRIQIFEGDGADTDKLKAFTKLGQVVIQGATVHKLNYCSDYYIIHTTTNLYVVGPSLDIAQTISEDCIYDVYCTGNNVLIARYDGTSLGDTVNIKCINVASNPGIAVILKYLYDSESTLLNSLNSEILIRDF